MENLFKFWTDTSKEICNRWVETVEQALHVTPTLDPREILSQNIALAERLVEDSISTQKQLNQAVQETVSLSTNSPEAVTDAVNAACKMNEEWIEMRRNYWENAFTTIRQVEDSGFDNLLASGQSNDLFKMIENSIEAQSAWMNQVAPKIVAANQS